jgi:acyl carrier protein
VNESNALTTVLDVIREVGGVTDLEPDQDFYEAGVTSVLALSLLLELEDKFAVAIPDERFIAARSPRALCAMIEDIKRGA